MKSDFTADANKRRRKKLRVNVLYGTKGTTVLDISASGRRLKVRC